MIDLHVHTTCSDGAFTPQAALACARQQGLSAIALTDHDTLDGWSSLAAAGAGPEVVPAVELSAFWGGCLTHILGYFVERSAGLLAHLQTVRERNQTILRDVCRHLREQEGIPVSYEELLAAGAARPTLALLALRLLTRGHARDWKEVGAVWGRIHRRLEGKYPPPSLAEGVVALRSARALIVIAHPGSMPMSGAKLDRRQIIELRERGLHGLEIYHPRHRAEDVQLYRRLAEEFGLAISGGSDAHGRGARPDIGSQAVDDEVLREMKRRHAEIYGQRFYT